MREPTRLVLLHASQLSQVCDITSGMFKLLTISSGRSSTVQTKPADRCHAMWQWRGQIPGLSWFHCRTMYELAWSWATSRLAGLDGLVTVPSQQVPNCSIVSPAIPSPMIRRVLSSSWRSRALVPLGAPPVKRLDELP